MAGRPPKEGIDYAGWDVNIFDNDTKIDKLLDAQGSSGFLIYFYLCQKAYGSNGYYYLWSFDDSATTARKIGGGVGSESVKNTVNLCLRIGLFDKDLFEKAGVITSRGIQKRFWQVAKDRTYKKVISEYWLLNEKESAGVTFDTQKSNYAPSKSNYTPSKSNYTPLKESKVKESNNKELSSKVFADDSQEIMLSKFLYELMLKNNSNAKQQDLQKWAKNIDLMIRVDKRNVVDIKNVIAFAQSNSFWRTNILSTAKLRDKFEVLYLQMIENKKKEVNNSAGYSSNFRTQQNNPSQQQMQQASRDYPQNYEQPKKPIIFDKSKFLASPSNSSSSTSKAI